MEELNSLARIVEVRPDRISALASGAPFCSPALAALTARFDRCLELQSSLAPGLACIGGLVRLTAEEAECAGAPALSSTGAALTWDQAALRCLGETAELLSAIERPGDVVERDGARIEPAGWYRRPLGEVAGPVDWVPGFRCIDEAPFLLPADLCLRRPPARQRITPAGALSSGVAAGFDRPSALCRAILELIERDAAALWWFGGRPGREFGEDEVARDATLVLAALRGGEVLRQTMMIDITTELGVPVVAAVARNEDGRDTAIGIAARLTPRAAAEAALTEMAQMEVAAELARYKLAAEGPAGIGHADRRHLSRAAADARSLSQFRPMAGSWQPATHLSDVDALVRHLHAMNVTVFATNLSRAEINVPVVRALSPDLQPFSLNTECDRLAAYPVTMRPNCPFPPY